MKIVGLITEYNPFHNGHLYHLEQAKKITGADYAIAVMSGNYVQRGTPAVFDKYTRTKMAIACGVDLVLELPICYAASSAEYFSMGAVSLLDALGVVDFICFGSEYGDIDPFMTVAEILYQEPHSYRDVLKSSLKAGHSFPLARMQALLSCYGHDISGLTELISKPNNILGIEYCKALLLLGSNIAPLTIPRKSSNYHDQQLQAEISSATAIRKAMEKQDSDDLLKKQMPPNAYTIFQEAYHRQGPVTEDDFSLLLKYKIMEENIDSLQTYADVTPDLAARIYNRLNDFSEFSSFVKVLKTKELTYTRISRALLHILLQMKKDSIPPKTPYARILGFKKDSQELLPHVKQASRIPLLSKLASSKQQLSSDAQKLLQKEIWASNLYESVSSHKFSRDFIHDLQQTLIIH